MRTTFAKKLTPKAKSQGSGALLDEYDRHDLSDKKMVMGDQYDDLLQDSSNYRKTIAAHDFDDDERYKGKKVSRKELYGEKDKEDDDQSIDSHLADMLEIEEDDEEGGEEEDFEEEEEEEEEVVRAPKKQNKQKKSLGVDDLLKDIDAEDNEIVSSKKDKSKELKKAKAVKQQQTLLDMIVESRVKMQDMEKIANRFPYPESFPYINKVDTTKSLKRSLQEVEVEVLDLIDMFDDIGGTYHEKVESECQVTSTNRLTKAQKHLKDNNIASKDFVKSYDFDTEQIWKSLDEDFNAQIPYIDGIVSNWAQKLNIMTQSSIKGRFTNIFQTPTQQTQRAMDDFDRLLKRSQLRDLSSKPLFEFGESSTNYSEEIYNDEEFYMTIFREMLQKQAQAETQNAENGEFLVENTRLYIRNKQLRSSVPKKDVDRRASKNRKLRYDVHQKLMNFMAPLENVQIIPGRDQILKNLFGLYEKMDDDIANRAKEASLKKKRRKNPTEDDVQINLL